VLPLGVGGDLRPIGKAVREWKPAIAFNLVEAFDDVGVFDQNIVSYLELLRLPYTGCNPRGLLLARDKALSKSLLAYHRIPVPAFAVFPMDRKVRRPKRLGFPLIVKSLTTDASMCISQASVVTDDEHLSERVEFVHKNLGTDAIAEQYIDGREFYVGVLGNRRLRVLPVWELVFKSLPEGAWRIATERVKWNAKQQKSWGVRTAEARDLPNRERERIQRLCKRAYKILWMSGYGRMDLRLDDAGNVYFLEANPNPQLAYGEDFAESAEKCGIPYDDLMQRILNFGLRWRPERLG